MIVLLNVSKRIKYCTIRLQINNDFKAEFDCLKTDDIQTVLVKAADAFEIEEREKKIRLFRAASDPDFLNKMLSEQNTVSNRTKDIKSHPIENLFTISNITEGGVSNSKLNDYEIKINEINVGNFQFDRNEGLSNCLRTAAENISDIESCQLLTSKLFYNKKRNNLKNKQ